MLMNMHDITVESVNGDTLIALCSFAAMTDEWPSVFVHNFNYWLFECQEPMSDVHGGMYAGRAKYVRSPNLYK